MLDEAVELFRSPRADECEDRAFVLTAIGLPNEIARANGYFILWVDAWSFAQARYHIEHHDAEAIVAPSTPELPKPLVHPHAWIGSIVYAAVLLFVSGAIRTGLGPLNAFELGGLDAARVQQGEWWRAWTALTLHLDIQHLVLNLGAGIWLGYLAGRRLGYGIAWMLIVSGAALANLLEALAAPEYHRAVGASTAVFAALGLLAAYAWVERYRVRQPWPLRWGPLVAGVILLGWTGSQGENTDVFAHIAGFSVAGLLGAVAASPLAAAWLKRVPQWAGGLVALGSIVLGWTCVVIVGS
jgi:rhomboid protease GluP